MSATTAPVAAPAPVPRVHLLLPHEFTHPSMYLVVVIAIGICVWTYIQARVGFDGLESVGGGLNYVVGPMGSGKSMFGVRRIVSAVCSGSYCVTNVRLLDGWAERVARHEFWRDKSSPERLARRVAWLQAHYVYETSLEQAMRYRLPCVVCGGDSRECGHPQVGGEARAVFVWDETHNDLNNRDYQGHGNTQSERETERERRRLILRWATQLRKLGFVGFLLSQHHENTDAQLRRVCNHIIRLQNQRHAGKFGKLLPKRFTMFLAYWFPAHLADKSVGGVKNVHFERYFLPWTRHLYDTMEVFHGLDAELDDDRAPIVLPKGGWFRGEGPRDSGPAPLPPPAPALLTPVNPQPSLTSKSDGGPSEAPAKVSEAMWALRDRSEL